MSFVRSPLHTTLAGFCLIMSLTLIYTIAAPLPTLDPPSIQLQRRSIAAITPAYFSPPSSAAFSSINDRPLFNPLRKPIATSEGANGPAANAPPPAPTAVLVGVIMDGQTKMALLKTQTASFAISATIGTSVDGWQITEIDLDKVVLSSGTFEHEIRLDANRPTQPSVSSGPAQAPNSFQRTMPSSPVQNSNQGNPSPPDQHP